MSHSSPTLETAALELPRDYYDIIIVGGGPAGSALAALLAQAGREVVLFDRDQFPRDKLCGEFLSHEAEHLLRKIGCWETVLVFDPAPIHQACFTSPRRKIWFTLPGPALGLSRLRLDATLLNHAAASGAAIFNSAEVLRIEPGPRLVEVRFSPSPAAPHRVRANLIIAAYGRRCRLDHQLGRKFISRSHPCLGLKRHHRPLSPAGASTGVVEMFLFDGGYCGFAPIEGGLVNVCMLLHKTLLGQALEAKWDNLLGSLGKLNPELGHRLLQLQPADGEVQAVAQVPMVAKERAVKGVLFIGDAAGMIAPFCGDGQGMALESAVLLADLISGLPNPLKKGDLERLTQVWDCEWRRWFSWRIRLGRLFQAALFRPRAADIIFSLLETAPALKNYLVRVTRGR